MFVSFYSFRSPHARGTFVGFEIGTSEKERTSPREHGSFARKEEHLNFCSGWTRVLESVIAFVSEELLEMFDSVFALSFHRF